MFSQKTYLEARPDLAVVASPEAARQFGLRVLESGIGDQPDTETRYLVLAKQPLAPDLLLGGGGPLRMSIALALRNNPGSFFRALSCFAFRNLNVLKVESRPAARAGRMFTHRDGEPPKHWEQVFYIDFEPGPSPEVAERTLEGLREFCVSVRVLGAYRQNLNVDGGGEVGCYGVHYHFTFQYAGYIIIY